MGTYYPSRVFRMRVLFRVMWVLPIGLMPLRFPGPLLSTVSLYDGGGRGGGSSNAWISEREECALGHILKILIIQYFG